MTVKELLSELERVGARDDDSLRLAVDCEDYVTIDGEEIPEMELDIYEYTGRHEKGPTEEQTPEFHFIAY